jgi:uncharacterized protein
MDLSLVLIGVVLFWSAFTQSVSGFGVALVSMALLPLLIDVQSATALVALIVIVVDIGVLARYYKSLRFGDVWPLLLPSFFGVPLGIFLLRYIEESVMLLFLGIILVGYAVYALMGFRLFELKGRGWAYLAGFLGGLLGGAYNANGPPIIIYANCRRWKPDVFKGNLQSFFLFNSFVIAIGHAVGGNFTPEVWRMFLAGLPGIILGLLAGIALDKRINPIVFRKIVLVLLLVMGIKMIF